MRHYFLKSCAAILFAGSIAFGAPPHSGEQAQRALIQQYCAGCHNQRTKSASLDLVDADLNNVPSNARMWETVIRKLRAAAMPPIGAPRPERAALDGFAGYLENAIDTAQPRPDPGPSALRRLNRYEYRAAVRDLLDLDIDVASLLPADDSNKGFDNNADALRVSPVLLDAYLAAGRKISRLAVGDPSIVPGFTTYKVRPDAGQDAHVEGLPLGTRGGLVVQHNFPLDGLYRFRPRLALNTSAKVRGLDYQHHVIVTLDGVKVHEALVGGPEDADAAAISPPDSEADIHKRLDFSIPVNAGPHKVGFTFVRKTGAQPDGYLQPWLRSNFDTQEQRGVPLADSLSIGGPFESKGVSETPSRKRIFVCRPAAPAEDIGCAKTILASLARSAWRRPVTDGDIETLLGLYQSGAKDAAGNTFDAGIENGIRFILTSPAFLFRVEEAPRNRIEPITSLELASRLSFFLWSSLPDDELLRVATAGKLREPPILTQQVRRMLSDRRSESLADNFADQCSFSAISPGPQGISKSSLTSTITSGRPFGARPSSSSIAWYAKIAARSPC
jgi:hypothetical protein